MFSAVRCGVMGSHCVEWYFGCLFLFVNSYSTNNFKSIYKALTVQRKKQLQELEWTENRGWNQGDGSQDWVMPPFQGKGTQATACRGHGPRGVGVCLSTLLVRLLNISVHLPTGFFQKREKRFRLCTHTRSCLHSFSVPCCLWSFFYTITPVHSRDPPCYGFNQGLVHRRLLLCCLWGALGSQFQTHCQMLPVLGPANISQGSCPKQDRAVFLQLYSLSRGMTASVWIAPHPFFSSLRSYYWSFKSFSKVTIPLPPSPLCPRVSLDPSWCHWAMGHRDPLFMSYSRACFHYICTDTRVQSRV